MGNKLPVSDLRLTGELRWLSRPGEPPYVLQQEWESLTTYQKIWRDVQVVLVPAKRG